jgi:hypothetical protein
VEERHAGASKRMMAGGSLCDGDVKGFLVRCLGATNGGLEMWRFGFVRFCDLAAFGYRVT